MKKKKHLLTIVIFFLAITAACSGNFASGEIRSGVGGDIVNEQEALDAREVLEDNLDYSNTKDIEGYLSTIASEGHKETREIIEPFFEENDIHHELLNFEVLTQEKERIMAKSRQKTINENPDKNDDEMVYRNHIAEVLLEFTKEDGEWKIIHSSISDVEFIE